MRVLSVVGLMILLLETVLALAYWGGTVWIGGWQGGVILLFILLLILIFPWVGSLVIEHDFLKGQTHLRLGWVGRIIIETAPDRETHFRFLFITWRSHSGSRKKEEDQKRKGCEQKRDESPILKRILERTDNLNVEPLSRMVVAVLQALSDLFWEAQEISLRIQAPTQIAEVDQMLALLVRSRWFGPVNLKVTGEGESQVLLRYRIGLLRGALIGVYSYLQGSPRRSSGIKYFPLSRSRDRS